MINKSEQDVVDYTRREIHEFAFCESRRVNQTGCQYGYEHRNIPPKAVSRIRIGIRVWVRVRVLVENGFNFSPIAVSMTRAAVGLSSEF